MAAPKIPQETIDRAAALYAQHKSTVKVAEIMGVSDPQVGRYLRLAGVPRTGNFAADRKAAAKPRQPSGIELPVFPDEDIPVEDIIELQCRRFYTRLASHEAHTWFPIKVKDKRPIGILWFGDPHVDDDGCNWPALKRDIALCKDTEGLYGANIGDTTNNWAGRLARLYAEQDASVKTARRLAKWFLLESGVPWLVWIMGNHDCVTPEHEVFTRRGWIRFPDVVPTDEVLGFDHEAGCSRWQAINEIVSFPYSGPLYSYDTNRLSIRCTPNHRFLARPNRRRYPFQYVYAENLPREFTVRNAAGVAGRSGVALSDDEIRLAAWLLSDGSISQGKYVTFYQSKEDGCAEIRRLLSACGLAYTEVVRERDIEEVCGRRLVAKPRPQREFRLTPDASARMLQIVPKKGSLPAWCADMCAEQFSAFFSAYVAADGSPQWHGKSGAIYGTRAILDELHWLCALNGQPASLSQSTRGDWLLNYCFREETDVARPAVVERYDGEVWCLRVPMSNFLIRHNGKAHFTGNSWGDGAEVLAQMAKQHGTQKIICHDWEARFSLAFHNGWQPRIFAAHDFPGHSQWNPLHGPMKAGQMGDEADLFVCGHKHNSAYFEFENAARGRQQRFLRVRGYKFMDDYARRLGIQEQTTGCAGVSVFDPAKRTISVFTDAEVGADFLKFLRSKAK